MTPVLAESNYMQTRIEFLSATNAISTDHEVSIVERLSIIIILAASTEKE